MCYSFLFRGVVLVFVRFFFSLYLLFWLTTHTRVAWVRRSTLCETRFCFQVDIETVLGTAIFAYVTCLRVCVCVWIKETRNRLREGIGRV